MSVPSVVSIDLICPICHECLTWSGTLWLHADGSGVDGEGNYICTKFKESELLGGDTRPS